MTQTLSVITLDGPAGVGKSTLAKRLAKALHRPYLDTGAMFRSLALHMGHNVENMTPEEVRSRCMGFSFDLLGIGEESVLMCNGKPVGAEIRSEDIAQKASQLAKDSVIRDYLKEAQRLLGAHVPLVAEGRDMGTVVFPTAKYKFFVDARPEVRAKRRYDELTAAGKKVDLKTLVDQIHERDIQDRNRAVAPLVPAEDALMVDTSNLTIDEVLTVLLTHIGKSRAEKATTFSHLDSQGNITMVDVGAKTPTQRVAMARAIVEVSSETMEKLKANALPKGDVLTCAKLAGIMAAKRTAELIPLCHPIPLSFVDIRFTIRTSPPALCIEAETRTTDRTGVEMEAIIAAQTAAATIYDMCKAVQRDICIRDVRLVYKSGGKSSVFDRRQDT